jgi:uncharacterized membrane protein
MLDEVPSMWRSELWHPLTAHFPIGLLLLTPFISLGWVIWNKKNIANYLLFTHSLLLWAGTLFLWIAVYSGEIAYSTEVRRICDPTVLKDHLRWAYIASAFFSIAVIIDVTRRILKRKNKAPAMYTIIVCVLLGAAALSYVGHLGAKLVYQQGAGVYQPSENCIEFE